MKNTQRILSIIMICFLWFTLFAVSVIAASGPTIQTSLTDGSVQRGSKKTFDVWARSTSGKKIASVVTLNGKLVTAAWDDSDKTSYTLKFTQEGANKVVVKASDSGKTIQKVYTIHYKKAKNGDIIGQVTWSIELLTIGNGYLIEPVTVNIIEGENSADALLKLLKQNGYVAYYGGNTEASFYLAYIADGDKTAANYNNYINSAKAVGKPVNPQKLNITSNIPKVLYPYLKQSMDFFDDKDYESNWKGYIGEFAYTNGSGWMYSVNNIYPNVSFADTYLTDGDVVRVQYTLAYGADIGGTSSLGAGKDLPSSSFFKIANKDQLTALIAKINGSGEKSNASLKKLYQAAVEALKKIDISQSEIDNDYAALNNAYTFFMKAANTVTKTTKVGKNAQGSTQKSSVNSSSITNSSNTAANRVDQTTLNSDTNTGGTTSSNQVLSENEMKYGGKKSVVIILVSFCSIAAVTVIAIFIYKSKKEKEI